MTLRDVLLEGTQKLESAGIEEAALDAWYLLEHVTGMSRAAYLADSGREMDAEQKERYVAVITRRSERIPLQHITGVQEFMGLEFQVNEHVLIPRQDTEILVETALEELKNRLCVIKAQKMTSAETEMPDDGQQIRLLDMCTGSGCILLSTLYYAEQEARKSGLSENDVTIAGMGIDISPDALCMAKQNSEKLDIEAEWLESDLFTEGEGTFDLILSNPPYIPSAVIETLQPEVKKHDPRIALDGKEDGLYFYRRIAEESRQFLKPGGRLIFEIGFDQGRAVSSYMKECRYTQIEVKKDLAGLDRVVSGVYDTSESR